MGWDVARLVLNSGCLKGFGNFQSKTNSFEETLYIVVYIGVETVHPGRQGPWAEP